MSDRKINYIIIFAIIALFVLEANASERIGLLLAVIVSIIAAYTAFLFNTLTIDGSRAAVVIGIITLGFGGLEPTVVVAAFFLSSNIVGPIFGKPIGSNRIMAERRTGAQVWANSFWFVISIMLYFVTKADMFLVSAYAAIAAANSDTWATEVGTRIKRGSTRLILGFQKVNRGTDGGVSVAGTLAAFFGAVFIAVISLYFPKNFMLIAAVSVVSAGLLGSLTDSLLGAWFQAGGRRLPPLLGTEGNHENNTVNFIATGFGMLYGLTIYNILVYVLV
ncbi:MAG: DUF92 domain-containing protein [Bacteroidetes bacterium]|nr:DUF92 domain-containing protein [Bacteroidota bacterium]MCH8523064.1 DUF92 domain-containing protein [Balneolales bacterium]